MKHLTDKQIDLRNRAIKEGAAMMAEIHSRPGFDDAQNEWHNEYNAAVALCAARKRAGLSQQTVAERMRIPRSNVSRIEGGLNITFATFAKYLKACGFDFSVSIRPAELPAQFSFA